MKNIKLTQGKLTLVDDSDYEWLNQWKWHFISGRYAARRVFPANKIVYLHRFILDAPKGVEVDHINGNKLDNRRNNLRFVTHRQNLLNRKKQANNTSGFKGVIWDKQHQKWRASTEYRSEDNRKFIHIGLFNSKEEAAKAYNTKVTELFGNYALLNEI